MNGNTPCSSLLGYTSLSTINPRDDLQLDFIQYIRVYVGPSFSLPGEMHCMQLMVQEGPMHGLRYVITV